VDNIRLSPGQKVSRAPQQSLDEQRFGSTGLGAVNPLEMIEPSVAHNVIQTSIPPSPSSDMDEVLEGRSMAEVLSELGG